MEAALEPLDGVIGADGDTRSVTRLERNRRCTLGSCLSADIEWRNDTAAELRDRGESMRSPADIPDADLLALFDQDV